MYQEFQNRTRQIFYHSHKIIQPVANNTFHMVSSACLEKNQPLKALDMAHSTQSILSESRLSIYTIAYNINS